MNFDNVRRPVRVSLTPPTEPAMPPSRPSTSDERWAQQVRMVAVQASATVTANDRWPLDFSVLDGAAAFERYILTGETKEPQL